MPPLRNNHSHAQTRARRPLHLLVPGMSERIMRLKKLVSPVFRGAISRCEVDRLSASGESRVRRKEQWHPTSREKRARCGAPVHSCRIPEPSGVARDPAALAACCRYPLCRRTAFRRSPSSSFSVRREEAEPGPAGSERLPPACPPVAAATPAFRSPGFPGRPCLLADAKKLLEDIALIPCALVAGLRGRCSVEKNRIVVCRATGIREQVRHFVQPHRRNPGGRDELARIGVLRQLDRVLHELRPDGRRGFAAFQLQIRIVVIADPDDAQQVAGKAGEPRIVRGAGFARCRGGEACSAHRGSRAGS